MRFPSLLALRKAHSELLTHIGEHTEERLAAALVPQVQEFVDRAVQTGEILYDWDSRNRAQGVVSFWTGILRENDPGTKLKMLANIQGPDQSKPPYKGLETFASEDELLFFGRRELVGLILEKMKTKRLVGVLGLSGTGKSSVVLAGIIPAIRQGVLIPGSEEWCVILPLNPGTNPIETLQLALAAKDLKEDPQSVLKYLSQDANRPSVLVIDQLEELFAFEKNGPDEDSFLKILLAIASTPSPAHRVIFTMRSDYEPKLARIPEFKELADESRFQVPTMSRNDLEKAITIPASIRGVRIEDSLVRRLVDAVLGEPAGLPLLQFSLLKLWSKRADQVITEKTFDELGGSPQAVLNSAAENVLGHFADGADKEDSQNIFEMLVTFEVGNEPTKKQRTRKEFWELGARERIDTILDKWCSAGLIKTRIDPFHAQENGEDLFEIAHEALIRNWPTLRVWIENLKARKNRELFFLKKAKEWKKSNKKDALMNESEIEEAEIKVGMGANLDFQEYLEASKHKIRASSHRKWALVVFLFVFAILLFFFLLNKQGKDAEQLVKAKAAEVLKFERLIVKPKFRVDKEGQFAWENQTEWKSWKPTIEKYRTKLMKFLQNSPVARTMLFVRKDRSWLPAVSGTAVLLTGDKLLTASRNTSFFNYSLGDGKTRLEVVFLLGGKERTFTVATNSEVPIKVKNGGNLSLLKLDGDVSMIPKAVLSKSFNPEVATDEFIRRPIIMLGYIGNPGGVSADIVQEIFKIKEWNQFWLRFGVVFGSIPQIQLFNHSCTSTETDMGAPLFDLMSLDTQENPDMIGLTVGGSPLGTGITTTTALQLWNDSDAQLVTKAAKK